MQSFPTMPISSVVKPREVFTLVVSLSVRSPLDILREVNWISFVLKTRFVRSFWARLYLWRKNTLPFSHSQPSTSR